MGKKSQKESRKIPAMSARERQNIIIQRKVDCAFLAQVSD